MSEHFKDKVYLITGGASGIGLATARLLKAQGAQPILWDINDPALQPIGNELGVETHLVDITDHIMVKDATDSLVMQHGKLDGVVHCAGVMTTGLFEDIDIERHCEITNINLNGTLIVCHATLPHLKHTNGSLILLSSVSAFYGPPEFASYAASKSAILNFAQALRIELGDSGVHLGVVTPHLVDTPLLSTENRKAKLASSTSVFVNINRVETIAQAIVNGIEKRQFMIFTGLRSRVIYLGSRYLAWLTASVMNRTWRSAK